jgi:hypothetical protein
VIHRATQALVRAGVGLDQYHHGSIVAQVGPSRTVLFRAANLVQLLAAPLLVVALASKVGGQPVWAAALPELEPATALPALPLVPDWRHWLSPTSPNGLRGWLIEPGAAPVRRLQLRWVYTRLVELPEVDRVGRFAHVDLPLAGVSAGPELFCLAPAPPRDHYPRTRELTPSWSWWYVDRAGWAVGIATGTRFLLGEHSGTIVDPLTSEARWAFFLP